MTTTPVESWNKLLSSITDSSVWVYDDQTRIVWITMIAMADRHGFVKAAIPGLANRARVSVEAAERALEIFKAPDPYSRCKDYDGRRIEDAPGGYLLLSHARIREMRSDEATRERKRRWWRENRGKGAKLDVFLDDPDPNRPHLPHAEAEAEADSKKEPPCGVSPPSKRKKPTKAAKVAKVLIDHYHDEFLRTQEVKPQVIGAKHNKNFQDLYNSLGKNLPLCKLVISEFLAAPPRWNVDNLKLDPPAILSSAQKIILRLKDEGSLEMVNV